MHNQQSILFFSLLLFFSFCSQCRVKLLLSSWRYRSCAEVLPAHRVFRPFFSRGYSAATAESFFFLDAIPHMVLCIIGRDVTLAARCSRRTCVDTCVVAEGHSHSFLCFFHYCSIVIVLVFFRSSFFSLSPLSLTHTHAHTKSRSQGDQRCGAREVNAQAGGNSVVRDRGLASRCRRLTHGALHQFFFRRGTPVSFTYIALSKKEKFIEKGTHLTLTPEHVVHPSGELCSLVRRYYGALISNVVLRGALHSAFAHTFFFSRRLLSPSLSLSLGIVLDATHCVLNCCIIYTLYTHYTHTRIVETIL